MGARLGRVGAFAVSLSFAAVLASGCSPESGAPAADSASPPAQEEGIAVAFVYDTSGSMAEKVADGHGGKSPKWTIANRAFLAIVERLQEVVKPPAPAVGKRIDTMLVRFEG